MMEQKRIEAEDLYAYRFPRALSLSPKGTHLAFLLTHASKETDRYESDIWLMEPKASDRKLRQLTASGDVKAFSWEDEEHILFLSEREKTAGGRKGFYRIDIGLGEAEKACEIPEALDMPRLLSDGSLLVRVRRETDPKEAEADRAQEGKDYWTFTDKPFIRNGEWYGARRRIMLAVWREGMQKPEAITPKFYEVAGFSVSMDGKRVLYFGEEYENCGSLYQSLYEYNAETKETKELIAPGRMQISQADYCEDGIFLQASELLHSATQNHDLWYYDLKSGDLKKTASPDGMYSSLIDIDVTYGAGKNHKILKDRYIGARLAGTKTRFDEVEIKTGKIRKIGETDAYTCLDAFQNDIYMVALEEYRLSEIWHMDRESGKKTRLTDFGGAYLESHIVSVPEKLSFRSRNGEAVEGFVIKPADFSEDGRYPGVLMIHGGPKWSYSKSFMHQMQYLAAAGMFVFFCNPHGGDGYGDSFLEMVGSWGKDDYLHCMEFTDACLRAYPQLDENRLGVTGGSYGGYMTNWIIGHTDRFRAAVSQRGICNMITEDLIADLGERLMKQAGGAETPWTNEALFWEMSPLKYAKNVKTPTLIMHSDRDFRCFPGEAMQFFTALKQCGVETELLLFHGDDHGLSRSGRPSHRIVRLKALSEWFMKYL